MKKLVTNLSIAASALVLMFGLSFAMPSADADAARWSAKTYRTLSQCKIARNAALGSGYRGKTLGSCEAFGAAHGVIIGYKYKMI